MIYLILSRLEFIDLFSASLCGSKASSVSGSIKDFWGVVVPSDFMPRGGGKTIEKHSVRLPRQNCYCGGAHC